MASIPRLQLVTVGQTFQEWADLRYAVQNWAIQAKFSFRVEAKNKTRAWYACSEASCQWKVRARFCIRQSMIVVRSVNSNHTCYAVAQANRNSASRQNWIPKALSEHLQITNDTRPKEIAEALRHQYGEEVQYQVAQKARLSAG